LHKNIFVIADPVKLSECDHFSWKYVEAELFFPV